MLQCNVARLCGHARAVRRESNAWEFAKQVNDGVQVEGDADGRGQEIRLLQCNVARLCGHARAVRRESNAWEFAKQVNDAHWLIE
ncbi:hypothetical protein M513_12019 [Trichuris suis]|uniref:Uncharacterized protein n=1 Tax=Trichuris suis TaxID=68888 RepID=A0A085LQ63_9BILA|nr:hypothetical protein M513_12019 [Trichuris suis]